MNNYISVQVRGYRRKSKLRVLFGCFVCFVGIFSVLFFAFMLNKKRNAIQKGYELYGNYQFQIRTASLKTVRQIGCEEIIVDSNIYSVKDNYYDDIEACYEYYIDTNFFDFSNIKLIKGNFPQNSNEILCENKFLYKKNIEFGNNTYIELGGKQYKVSGVVAVNNVSTSNMYIPIFLHRGTINSPGEKCIACMTADNKYVNAIDSIKDKYSIPDEDVGYNANVLSYANIDQYGNNKDITDTVKYIFFYIALGMLFLILFCLNTIICKLLKNDFAIYRSLGYSKKTIIKGYITYINRTLLISAAADLAVNICVFLCVRNIAKWHMNIGQLLITFSVCEACMMLFVVVCSYFVVNKQIHGIIHKSIVNVEDVHIKNKAKSKLYNSKWPLIKLATNCVKKNRLRYFLSVITIVVCIALVALFKYISPYFFVYEKNDDFEYRIDYEYSSMDKSVFGSDEVSNMYKDMLQRKDLFDVCPLYYSNVSVTLDKTAVSEEYRKMCAKQSQEYYNMLYVNKSKKFKDNVLFVGVDEWSSIKICGEKLSIKDGEALSVKRADSPENRNLDIGIKEKSKVSYNIVDESNSKRELLVVGEIPDLKVSIPNARVSCILLVNMNTFKELEFYDYPQTIYFNSNSDSESVVTEYFRGIYDVNLVDIEKENQLVKYDFIISKTITYTMIGLLITILCISISIGLYERFSNNKKQYAMLKSIGISNIRLIVLQVYDYCKLIVISIVVGIAVSAIVNYIFYKKMAVEMSFLEYRYSISYTLLPMFCVVLMFVVSTIPSVISIRKLSVLDDLQRNR